MGIREAKKRGADISTPRLPIPLRELILQQAETCPATLFSCTSRDTQARPSDQNMSGAGTLVDSSGILGRLGTWATRLREKARTAPTVALLLFICLFVCLFVCLLLDIFFIYISNVIPFPHFCFKTPYSLPPTPVSQPTHSRFLVLAFPYTGASSLPRSKGLFSH